MNTQRLHYYHTLIPHNTNIAAAILIGSHARGDHNEQSDIDVVLVWKNEIQWHSISMPPQHPRLSLLHYTMDELNAKHLSGDIFLLHVITEGVALYQERNLLQRLKSTFQPALRFPNEFQRLHSMLDYYSQPPVIRDNRVAALSSLYSIYKHCVILSLAANHIYEFNWQRARTLYVSTHPNAARTSAKLDDLKPFYLAYTRGIHLSTPRCKWPSTESAGRLTSQLRLMCRKGEHGE